MSTIAAQNYGDGTDSVPASAVIEGTAKAWLHYDQQGSGALASYNVSSVTDVSSGLFEVNFTNAFDAVNYGFSGAGSESGTAVNTVHRNEAQANSASVFYHRNTFANSASNGLADTNGAGTSYFGDLA